MGFLRLTLVFVIPSASSSPKRNFIKRLYLSFAPVSPVLDLVKSISREPCLVWHNIWPLISWKAEALPLTSVKTNSLALSMLRQILLPFFFLSTRMVKSMLFLDSGAISMSNI